MKNLPMSLQTDRRTLIKAIGAGLVLAATGLNAASIEPVVQTTEGAIEGIIHGNVASYLGIRYAQSIAGRNRFKPPQPVEPWTGVRKAQSFAQASPQQPRSASGRTPVGVAFADDPSVEVGDDCLALNVWAPVNSDGRLPVMVWLHGGGFSSGSGSSPLTNGTNLAARGDVIVVTINHRLAASGYVDFSRVLGGDFADSSNLGSRDIIAALQWVNRNIANFGGDPERVMIFGESGGGWKVATVMGMPAARGLVHRAVIQSGPLIQAMQPEQADEVAQIMLEELGVTRETASKIHDMSFEDIVAAEKRASARFGRASPGFPAGFWPVLDGVNIVDHVFDPQANATAMDIPLMVGQNGTEMSLFMLGDKAAYELDNVQLEQRLKARFGDANAAMVLDSYSRRFAEQSPSYLWFRILSDLMMGALSLAIADAKVAAGGAPVYTYRFEYQTPMMDGKLFSPHTLEIPFVFDTANDEGAIITGGGDAVAALAKTVSETWVQFARTGRPGAPGLPAWPEYTTEGRETMHLDNTSAVGTYIDPALVPMMYDLLFSGAAAGLMGR